MIPALYAFSLLSLLSSGAIFGFFYAWICSTMWGLDAADPALAIGAMQAMNASVRNTVFAPAFFATPFVLIATAMFAWFCRLKAASLIFAIAGLLYLSGGVILTMTVNVPMNEALAAVVIPQDAAEARRIWENYSGPWQFWNTVRTIVSGLTLALTGIAIFILNPRTA
ncbi:DUF1772 domain-containing protein [Rhizobium sp. P40RR-XXII]|uniref:anthrone oxygenase family protein n=1 Tax=unclassified Rhizobium TaxID=2613769 RepID=UPI001456DE71|nr:MULTISPECIES: anthrone oxygenase family protein [unclassified Rhizobium]NLR83865.1 DUF1772 domain-containing protein [Rhizobium sp. P28RR-XV]NLS15490.1 DUF1772 domain-containing protein [Rhizobium sp. P40RR-XXII]